MRWSYSETDHEWREIAAETVVKTPIFSLVRSTREDNKKRQGDFFIVQAPEWVTVIPLIEKPGEMSFLW